MQITSREKSLLCVLAIVMTATLGYKFILGPSIEKSKAIQIELNTYRDKQIEAHNLLLQAPSIEEALQEQQQLKESRIKPFFDIRDSEYLQRWVDTIQKKYDIKISQYQIGEMVVGEVDQYRQDDSVLEYPIKDYYEVIEGEPEVAEGDTETKETESLQETNEPIVQIPISLSLKGKEGVILDFVNQLIHNNKYVTVKSLDIKRGSGVLELTFYAVHRDKDSTLEYSFDHPVGQKNIKD